MNVADMREDISSLLASVQRHASSWFASLDKRPVRATASAEELRQELGGPLPQEGIAPERIAEILAQAGIKGATASTGPRYFGFVVGGNLPAALAADWLVSAWDQNAGLYIMSPVVSVIEQIAGAWLRELAGLPSKMSFGFVTGCHMATFTGLAAARHRVLRNAGWDVEAEGLFGAPQIEVVVNEEAHYTISTALRLLGLGANRVRRIPTDNQGRMRADALAAALRGGKGPCIICAQAGNVNTGAFDPISEIANWQRNAARGCMSTARSVCGLRRRRKRRRWCAASKRSIRSPPMRTSGSTFLTIAALFSAPMKLRIAARCLLRRRTSWPRQASATHTNLCRRNRGAHGQFPYTLRCGRLGARAVPNWLSATAARHDASQRRCVPRDSRCSTMLCSTRCWFRSATAEQTQRMIAAIQEDGTCWCGGTVWQGRTAMRISVSNWSTTDADVEQSIAAMIRMARKHAR